MKTKTLLAVAAFCITAVSSSLAQNWITDNFDSYANQAALDAVWANSGAAMTLDTAQAFSTPNSIYQGTVAQQSRLYLGNEISPENLDFSFQFYDPAGTTSLARTYGMIYARAGAGDWAGGLEQIIAIGKNNGTATTKYNARVAFGSANWFILSSGPDRSVGWHEARVVGDLVGGNPQYTFYIDGIVSGTASSTVQSSFDWVVMGSGLSSTHGMWYDNIAVAVPEPSSLAFALLGGFGLFIARMRRQ